MFSISSALIKVLQVIIMFVTPSIKPVDMYHGFVVFVSAVLFLLENERCACTVYRFIICNYW